MYTRHSNSIPGLLHPFLQKEIGAWNYLQLMEGVESFLYALFTRRLGYTKEEVELLCTRIKKEMKDPKLHAMVYM